MNSDLYINELNLHTLNMFQELNLEIFHIENNCLNFIFKNTYIKCYWCENYFTVKCKLKQNEKYRDVCYPIFDWPLSGYDYHGPYSDLSGFSIDKKTDIKQLLQFLIAMKNYEKFSIT